MQNVQLFPFASCEWFYRFVFNGIKHPVSIQQKEHVRVCVCVCERERVSVCVIESVCVCVCESVCV